jgi:fluoride exporter
MNPTGLHLLLVAAGGGLGAAARYLVNILVTRAFGPAFPWGTLCINVAGCFAMGIFIEWLTQRTNASLELRMFVATGILGGFTTFSAFSLDFAVLWERGAALPAFGYLFASVFGSLLALFLGLWLARSFA